MIEENVIFMIKVVIIVKKQLANLSVSIKTITSEKREGLV